MKLLYWKAAWGSATLHVEWLYYVYVTKFQTTVPTNGLWMYLWASQLHSMARTGQLGLKSQFGSRALKTKTPNLQFHCDQFLLFYVLIYLFRACILQPLPMMEKLLLLQPHLATVTSPTPHCHFVRAHAGQEFVGFRRKGEAHCLSGCLVPAAKIVLSHELPETTLEATCSSWASKLNSQEIMVRLCMIWHLSVSKFNKQMLIVFFPCRWQQVIAIEIQKLLTSLQFWSTFLNMAF